MAFSSWPMRRDRVEVGMDSARAAVLKLLRRATSTNSAISFSWMGWDSMDIPNEPPEFTCCRLFALSARLRTKYKYGRTRSAEHTSELPSLMRNSYAVFCLKQKNNKLLTSV